MKKVKVTKTVIIYNKEGNIVKQVDVTNLPWLEIYVRAADVLRSSLSGTKWEVIVVPDEKT